MTNDISFGRTASAYPEYTKGSASFGHSAVPYPEYEGAYYTEGSESTAAKIMDKIYSLFSPEVTQKSQEIKHSINRVIDDRYIQEPGFDENSKHRLYAAA